MADFILEIGTEEIPARFLADTKAELLRHFTVALHEQELAFEEVTTFTSPRRASIYIKNLAKKQEVREEVFLGPAEKIAYAEDGSFTKAAQGFARGHNVEEKAIFKQNTEKGVYIAVRKKVGGLSAKEVLAEICPKIILKLAFPKKMRWDNSNIQYPRPIQWILALIDKEVVPFSVGNTKSSNTTSGHRIHGKKVKEIASAQKYFAEIEKEYIILDDIKRKEIIVNKAEALAKKINAEIVWDESLLEEVYGLVEYPVPLLADFDESFLELPAEVLLTSMQSHQKSFGLADKDGNLMPHFLTTLNLEPKDIKVVKEGWEKVLRARLEDARFFWKTDNTVLKENGFEAWRKKLDKVIFLGPLGSIGDKCTRLEKLMEYSASLLSHDIKDIKLAKDAAKYSKVDLVSAMVNEFDTLQGIMGGIYADVLKQPELGRAIAGHYLPAGPETFVPNNNYAALLSLCDKADTLVGLFGLNTIPTGAADPYALRRCAISIARILRDKNWDIDIEELFNFAYSCYSTDIKWKLDKKASIEKLLEFYHSRIKNLLLSEGNDPLLVDAILNVNAYAHASMPILSQRLEALKEFTEHKEYITSIQSFKRISNIIRKQALEYTLTTLVSAEFFENDDEKNLANLLTSFTQDFEHAFNTKDFNACFNLLASLSKPIDNFFNSTMVMADDTKVRQNRLNLLYTIQQALNSLVDTAALQI